MVNVHIMYILLCEDGVQTHCLTASDSLCSHKVAACTISENIFLKILDEHKELLQMFFGIILVLFSKVDKINSFKLVL